MLPLIRPAQMFAEINGLPHGSTAGLHQGITGNRSCVLVHFPQLYRWTLSWPIK